MLKIYGRRNSINVQKVMWAVGELGLAHERIDVGGPFGGLNTPQFLTMNPLGRIPVIEDDGAIVWESHAIVRYLAAKYGEGSLWAADPAERSVADRWMDWAQADLYPAFFGVFGGFFRTPESQRNWPAIRAAQTRTTALYRILDKLLADQPFIAGGTFTMGDIPAGTTLYRYYNLEIERPHLPNLERYYVHLRERAVYREHVMISFEDLRGR
ncbi:MAG TPA: glutathione S-transferase family protein [Rhizomicrobium sp.]